MEISTQYVISLEIRGFDITEQEINSLMQLHATEFYDESCSKNRSMKTADNIWLHNLWIYEKCIDYSDFDISCKNFFEEIGNITNIMSRYNQISDARIHLFVNSDMAQLHIPISKQLIYWLNYYDLEMDVNIISGGLVV